MDYPSDLPRFYDAGGLVGIDLFTDVERLPGRTAVTYCGARYLALVRITNANGDEMPVIPGTVLAPGARIEIPAGRPGKIKAVGVVIGPDGKERWDTPRPV